MKTAEGLEGVYRDEARRLWRAVYAWAGDSDVASDAVAEAFAQCMERGPEVRSPAAWVWRAAFKIAAGELRVRGAMRPLEDRRDVPLAMSEPLWELLEALQQLPSQQRAAVIVHYYGGYSTRETASLLGCASATARVHLSQGRRRLRQLLEAMPNE